MGSSNQTTSDENPWLRSCRVTATCTVRVSRGKVYTRQVWPSQTTKWKPGSCSGGPSSSTDEYTSSPLVLQIWLTNRPSSGSSSAGATKVPSGSVTSSSAPVV